jgi:hypothetical protein
MLGMRQLMDRVNSKERERSLRTRASPRLQAADWLRLRDSNVTSGTMQRRRYAEQRRGLILQENRNNIECP